MKQKNRTIAQRRGMTRDLTVCGLFAALTAVGAFIKIVIPVGADTMNFTRSGFSCVSRPFAGIGNGLS